MEEPLVSVRIITYNQKDYIKNAIEGVLMQNTNFDYEIVIGDDNSDDGTSEIIETYKENYPKIIRHSVRESGNEIRKGFSVPRMYNWFHTVQECKGKYIAILDGDDYWNDPLKLQKQIDFLEQNPEYTLCSHEVYNKGFNYRKNFKSFLGILYKNFYFNGVYSLLKLFYEWMFDNSSFWVKRRKSTKVPRYWTADFKIALNTAFKNRYIPASSIVAKGSLLRNIPEDTLKYATGHKLVVLWAALNGDLRHFHDVMGVRFIVPQSVSKRDKSGDSKEDRVGPIIETLKILRRYASNEQIEMIDSKLKDLKKQLE